MTCVIIDYGSGNLHSALKSFERASVESGLNKKITLTNDPAVIQHADHIVLPGVGAYADCLEGLEAIEGLRETLEDMVINKARPFLGICVGMQLMSTEGHEHKVTKGLNWIKGKVVQIKPNDPSLKIPHMGWNTLSVCPFSCPPATGASVCASDAHDASAQDTSELSLEMTHPVLEGIQTGENGLHAYFVHSYHFEVEDEKDKCLTTDYGGPITAMVARDNMIGTQFHPEKSQTLGLKLITNFLKWKP